MYWGIPPEINAFRLTMVGAGPMAHVPQVAGYQAVAATHAQQGAQMAMTAAATSPSFDGVGGTAMMDAALPAAAWISTAGAHAEMAAATIQAGIDGYAAAVVATVPHLVVVANRVREATLEATNLLGQNTPAIVEANAEYAEFWGQNAGAMMGYLATVTGLLGSLSVPLAPVPMGANPLGMAAGVAAVAAQGAALGAQALSAGFSQGTSAASGVGAGVTAGVASAAQGAGQAGSGQPQPGSPTAASPAGKADGSELLGSAQAMMGPAMSAPSTLESAVSEPLSQAGQLPSMLGGQFGGLMSPALSAATGGLGGGPGVGPGSLGSGSPWSGLSSANGGYAGGGSAVSAALTKPSAGAGMAGPVGLPEGWWNNASGEIEPEADMPAAGVRGAAAPSSSAMGPGMCGMPAAGERSRRSVSRDVADADKSVVLDGLGDAVPVFTDNGVVYADGQGV
ncbi:MAG: PPE domain-containing protein [Mycobacteriaceae bacterium]|nr:PPE domain-containing protein [Mycobacteriaceae bacterium]